MLAARRKELIDYGRNFFTSHKKWDGRIPPVKMALL
jgi:hypothetical protein